MMKNTLMALCLLSSFSAFSEEESLVAVESRTERPPKTELQMGDLPDNAFTTYEGTFLIQPVVPSSYAITDNLEVKSSIFGLLGGPNATIEYALFKNSNTAISIEPGISVGWGYRGINLGGDLRFSQRAGSGFFNISAGGAVGTDVGLYLPLRVSYSLVTSPHTIWDFRISNDVGTFLRGAPFGTAGFMWHHSFGGAFQLGLGLNILAGVPPEQTQRLLQAFGINLPVVFLPLPSGLLSWKF